MESNSIPQCCCGKPDCAFLAHNTSLLEGLERDVHKAAQLGQALLVRHEAYVADSERDRKHMTTTIENVERDKLELEAKNAQTIKENRHLLNQLEQLNGAVADSDAQVKALTDTLHSTEEELQRLSALAARTQSLERQLIDLEKEQSEIHSQLESKDADEKTAIQRWKRAEKTIGDLQDQIDRIEKEAKEEQGRHEEIVARMERRVALNGELATAGERSKVQLGQKGGPGVVSHFVKDILLDNANLQHGILELREMLTNSNEEVERLREHLRAHQPVSPLEDDMPTPTLQKELGNDSVFNSQVHIHHHYHGTPQKKEKPKPQAHRRVRKKRFSSGSFTPPVPPSPSSAAAILAQTSVTVPPNSHRWSNATTLAGSSVPSSPVSHSHRGSIYDRVFSDAYDSSRPTSPSGSVDPISPMYVNKNQGLFDSYDDDNPKQKSGSRGLKPRSLATIRSVSSPFLTAKSSPATAVISAVSPQESLSNEPFLLSPSLHSTIPEESEDATTPETTSLASPMSPAYIPDTDLIYTKQRRPPLRRATSHESLISVSGMDIHTLQSRPSQLLVSSSPRFAPSSFSNSTQPELTPWTATATPTMPRRNLDSSTYNRSLLYGSAANQKRGVSDKAPSKQASTSNLGRKVGGWVFGKWGATPEPSRPMSSESKDSANSSKTVQSESKVKKGSAKKEVRLRPSGVNQNGPIWGFFDVPETPTKVHVTDFDEEALRDSLADV